MRVFTCKDNIDALVGIASVIVAESESKARRMLQNALAQEGHDISFVLEEIDLSKPSTTILGMTEAIYLRKRVYE